jgi:hypothetical protein
VNSISLEQVSLSTVLLVYHDTVKIVGAGDPNEGNTGNCDIAMNCDAWSTSGNTLSCSSSDAPPLSLQCWTSQESSSPVCEEPGSRWVGALIGCIVCGVIGVGFIICAISIRTSKPRDPLAINVVNDVSVVYPSGPVTVVGAMPVEVRTTYR